MNQKQIDRYRGSLLLSMAEAKEKNYRTMYSTFVACLNEFDKVREEPDIPNVTIEPDIYDMSDAD